MLLFVVARTRKDRYEELRREFDHWRDVRIILDRREGERRIPQPAFAGVDRRRLERRQCRNSDSFLKLGWNVVDTDTRGTGLS